MRTEQDINAEIEATRALYLAAVDNRPAREAEPHSKRIKELRAELCAALSAGASPCEHDGEAVAVVGMRRHFSLTPKLTVSLIEVGCLVCTKRAIAINARMAVEKWNGGEYAPVDADAMPVAVAQVWADAAKLLE